MQQLFTAVLPLPQLVEAVKETDPAAAQDAGALCRALCRYAGTQCADPVTGLAGREVTQAVFAPRAAALAAQGIPVAAAVVKVPEYAALAANESEAAAARCLSTAAGVLQTAVDATWPNAVVARWDEDAFLVAAAAEQSTLEGALQAAIDGHKRRFSITLARRGQFTMSFGAARWDEPDAGDWPSMVALAESRVG